MTRPAARDSTGRLRARALGAAAAALLLACGPAPRARPAGDPSADAPFVVAERGAGGVRLVFVSAAGARVADLTLPPEDGQPPFVVDTQPAWSADGRWIAFASNRGGAAGLWIARAVADQVPRRLTRPPAGATDRDPAWSPDGRALLFSSNRGGSYDLWRLEVDPRTGTPRGEPVPWLREAADLVTPAWSPDGRRVAYSRFDRATRTSSVWLVDASGRRPRRLTSGPLDQAPAWSPDGGRIAYSAPAIDRPDLDIFTIRADGTRERVAIDEPLAHETEPAWSADGRWLVATAVLRSERDGAPFFWSVVAADLRAGGPVRAVHDVAAAARVAFALRPRPVDARALAALPAYDRDAVVDAIRGVCTGLDDPPPACRAVAR
ncbi:MAG: hypothetical protein D6689_21970 [Deltaproteobacteria bacterium]|nr:MAG: hypothetical protein D6689_21970 [Deltaproteobacteria bacterium]